MVMLVLPLFCCKSGQTCDRLHVVLTFESVDEILERDHSNESN